MGSTCVSSCRCWVMVSDVAIQSAVISVICNLLVSV